MAACVERRAACGASYNACASGATPCKFETRQPARPAGKATADRQFQRRVRRREAKDYNPPADKDEGNRQKLSRQPDDMTNASPFGYSVAILFLCCISGRLVWPLCNERS